VNADVKPVNNNQDQEEEEKIEIFTSSSNLEIPKFLRRGK
jgi:hypothetical protein